MTSLCVLCTGMRTPRKQGTQELRDPGSLRPQVSANGVSLQTVRDPKLLALMKPRQSKGPAIPGCTCFCSLSFCSI